MMSAMPEPSKSPDASVRNLQKVDWQTYISIATRSFAEQLGIEFFREICRKRNIPNLDEFRSLAKNLLESKGTDIFRKALIKERDYHLQHQSIFGEDSQYHPEAEINLRFIALQEIESATIDAEGREAILQNVSSDMNGLHAYLKVLEEIPSFRKVVIPALSITAPILEPEINATAVEKVFSNHFAFLSDSRKLIPGEEAGCLGILCVLPRNTRLAVRPLLGAALLRNDLEEAAKDVTIVNPAKLSNWRQVLLQLAVTSQCWEDILKLTEGSPVLVRFVSQAALSLEKISAEMKNEPEWWMNKGSSMWSFVDSVLEKSEVFSFKLFETTDVGHGVNLMTFTYPLETMVKPLGKIDRGVASSLDVCIFEDDKSQEKIWREGVQSIPTFRNIHSSADAKSIIKCVSNTSYSLFVIDIENGSDKSAGIRLADKIIRERYAMNADPAAPILTGIHIWSSNPVRVKEAQCAIEALKQELDGPDSVFGKIVEAYNLSKAHPIGVTCNLKGGDIVRTFRDYANRTSRGHS